MAARPWTTTDDGELRAHHGAGLSLHAITKLMHRSKGTLSTHARALGLTWDRTTTANATRARVVDNKARRAALEQRLLVEADAVLDRLREPHVAFNFGGKDNTYSEHRFDRPPNDQVRTILQAAGIAIDRAVKLAVHDADTGAGEAAIDAWLEHMTGGGGGTMMETKRPPDASTSEGPTDHLD